MLTRELIKHSLAKPISDEIPDTTSSTIELSDRRRIKRSSKTLLLSAIIMPDLNIICISSVCSDLRFYDVSSVGKCNLRLYIRNFPSTVSALHYCADTMISKLVFGDSLGSVRVIDFDRNFRSQFREGSVMKQISYQQLVKVKQLIDEL